MKIKQAFSNQWLLIRQYGAWALSLGLFAVGSWSVYDIATSKPEQAAEATTADGATESTLSRSEQIDQLFAGGAASQSHPQSAVAPTSDAQSNRVDRYAADSADETAPALPPLAGSSDRYTHAEAESTHTARARDAAEATGAATAMPANPFASMQRNELDHVEIRGEDASDAEQPALTQADSQAREDRYATAELAANQAEAPAQPEAPSKPRERPQAEEAAQSGAAQRIMRGQEPDEGNPLRQADSVALASAEEAREAFQASEPLPPAQPLKVAAKPREVEDNMPTAQPLPARSYREAANSAGGGPTPVEAPTPQFTASAAAHPASPAAPPYATQSQDSNYESSSLFSSNSTPENSTNGEQAPLRDEQPSQATGQPTENAAPYGDNSQTRSVLSDGTDRLTPGEPSSGNPGLTPTPGINNTPGTGRPGERTLEGAQSPSIAIQKLAPPEIQVGKKCTFAVRVKNIGQRAAQNVVIHDEVPLGTQLVGTAPRGIVSGSQVKWDLGTLSVGEERIVEMELMPTDEGELGSVAAVTFAAQASAKTRSTRPQLALRLTSVKPQVMAGEKQLVQIEISNPGSGDATGVMLLETLPKGVSHEAGTALEFPVGTLKAGETRKLDLVLNAEQAGVINNVMTVRGDANLEVTASCEFEIVAPELKLSVDGPKRKYLERPATFVVNVDNPGTASAKDVQLVTQLPKGLKFVSANNMGEYDSTTHSVYWSLAELPANERGSVEVTALAVAPGDHTIKTATRAKRGLEDRAQSSLSVEGLAAIKFQVVDQVDPVEIGGETTYVIRVENQGSKAAANVQVVATLPEGMRAINATGDARHEIQGNRVVFSPLAQLTPKTESIFRIQVQGVRPGDQRLRVQLTTDEIQQPITKEESTRVYADQ